MHIELGYFSLTHMYRFSRKTVLATQTTVQGQRLHKKNLHNQIKPNKSEQTKCEQNNFFQHLLEMALNSTATIQNLYNKL